MELNKIYLGDCLEVLKTFPNDAIDLVVTSPPYNVGIDYDSWDDKLPFDEYLEFTKKWLSEVFRVLKKDGRVAINVLYEINLKERGGRILLLSEYWNLMKEIGFNFAGVVDLRELSPQISKLTAWGSWLSPSAPYIYNPKECVILAYKEQWKKERKGESYFNIENKKEFIDLASGIWDYSAETKGLTKANFSLDIPEKAIKILSWKDDVVLDPFIGSGTTAIACLKLNRNYIGIELSEEYVKIAEDRVNTFKEE